LIISYSVKPLARIVGFADAGKTAVEFTTAPALALPKALKNAGLQQVRSSRALVPFCVAPSVTRALVTFIQVFCCVSP
jgi:hypothetical protein